MNAEDLKTRTKQFALRIIRLAESLPKSSSGRVLSTQLLRAGTSVGSNYRSACRAKSRADFVAKMGIVEEECDESLYWMELLIEAGLVKPKSLANLRKEGSEILSIVVSSIKTARTSKEPAPRAANQK
jgi:four helix bundle protein